ncbi:MAG: dTMP kinase [Anaerolineae bacterium]|nr:dTMP kinase [Anaerolineae bacterium]
MAAEAARGLLVTFEGPEGSGKTTQLPLVARWLETLHFPVLCTREPGGTRVGERIRAVLHDPSFTEMAPVTEILLYSASRAQHVAEIIRPALAEGHIVLCDRYYDSTYAYQGFGRALSLDELRSITRFATGGLVPDVTLYLDLEPEVGLQRRLQGGEEMNRLDREALDFHRRVREGYWTLVRQEPQRWLVIDAQGTVAEVQARIRDALHPRLYHAANSLNRDAIEQGGRV